MGIEQQLGDRGLRSEDSGEALAGLRPDTRNCFEVGEEDGS